MINRATYEEQLKRDQEHYDILKKYLEDNPGDAKVSKEMREVTALITHTKNILDMETRSHEGVKAMRNTRGGNGIF